jgi:hypothetical protein
MSRECGRKSKALSIGASVAVVTTAAILSAGSYVGLFKRAEDMNTQEREISTELSEIALKSLGEGKDLALDCDISTLEEQFMDEDTYAWVIPNPYPGSGVVHFKSDFCDQFTSNDPYAVARFLFVYAFAVYVDEFVQLLKQQNPDADILLTIPPDSYRKRRKQIDA